MPGVASGRCTVRDLGFARATGSRYNPETRAQCQPILCRPHGRLIDDSH